MIYYIGYTPERWRKIKSNFSNYLLPDIHSWNIFDLIYYYPKEGVFTRGFISNCNIGDLERFNKKECNNLNEFINIIINDNMKKTFTKSDLKSGMVVRTRHNRMYLVVDNLLISNTGYMKLDSYTENLSHENSQYDIIQIYDKATCWGQGFSKGLEYISSKELLWERKEPKEYTMQEIADKLGIPVEELRIKK